MMVTVDPVQLEAHLLTIDLLQSMFPLPSELFLFPESAQTLDILRSLPSPTDPVPSHITDELRLLLRVGLDEENIVLEMDIKFPLRTNSIGLRENEVGNDDVAAVSSEKEPSHQRLSFAPTITLLEPSWLSHASFSQLTSQVLSTVSSDSSSTTSLGSAGISNSTIVIDKDDPTSVILQLVEDIKTLSQEYIPNSTTFGSTSFSHTRSTPEGREELENSADDQIEMSRVRDALICVSKMHHIVNQPKLRKLKALATSSGASGFVKSGRPGILLYEIGSKEELAKFLEGVRSLKYLEFHHLTSEPLYSSSSSPSVHITQSISRSKSNPKPFQTSSHNSNEPELLSEGKPGLVELDEVKDMLDIAEKVGRREWFREAIGMNSTSKKSG